ncbi:hypothetical protein FGIG_07085 [Fasciola gigantica]|uniref:Uncharacterized protein n=1 Tax=Fasciola gigantica TaxID=46835 RepID=A0A504Z5D1_FASGI|nr:hypothetical protein FGIG_07085 [Fasciola gigantica]
MLGGKFPATCRRSNVDQLLAVCWICGIEIFSFLSMAKPLNFLSLRNCLVEVTIRCCALPQFEVDFD